MLLDLTDKYAMYNQVFFRHNTILQSGFFLPQYNFSNIVVLIHASKELMLFQLKLYAFGPKRQIDKYAMYSLIIFA